MKMELTEEEKFLIIEMRKNEKNKEDKKKYKLEIIKTAYKFEKWNQKNDMCPSYSNFVDHVCPITDSFSYNLICKLLTIIDSELKNDKI